MKIYLKTLVMLAGVALLAASCQENDENNPARMDAEIDEVVNILADELLPIDVQGGSETEPFGLRTDETDQNARVLEGNRPPFPIIKLGDCVENLDFTEDQIRAGRELALQLFECRMEVHENFRAELKEVIKQMEQARKEAVQELRNEEITNAEFRAEMESIRERFLDAMKAIREKHKETIKPCLKEFVTELKVLLGEENWNKLITCLREKYKDSD